MSQAQAYERFKALHAGEGAFVMPNAWDGASAAVLKAAGFQALGTSSFAIALALGRIDGRAQVSRDEAIDNGKLLAAASGLPINGDLEDGFGPSPQDSVDTVEAAIAAGFAGLGIEDTTADPDDPILGFDLAVARIAAAAKASKGRILLTGRTDNYLHGRPDLDDTIRRLVAFAEAGADVLYAPMLPDMAAIEKVVQAVSPNPVNVLIAPASGPVPLAELSRAGVKRVSLGSGIYAQVQQATADIARSLAAGDFAPVWKASPVKQIIAAFGGWRPESGRRAPVRVLSAGLVPQRVRAPLMSLR